MNDQHNPFFSVVVPVHNKAPHINRSISSILNQTFGDFELLVIDDASTDTSLEEIRRFDDPRIRVRHRETPGPGGYAARNLGIAEARADWIAFLDADDEWYPEHLLQLQALICRNLCKCVAQGWIDVSDGTERIFGASRYIQSTAVVSFTRFLSIGRKGSSVFNMNTVAVHRALFTSVGGFPAGACRRGGDVATWLKVVRECGGVLMTPEPGARYFRDDSFVTKTTEPETQFNCVVLEAMRLLDEQEVTFTERRLLKQFSNSHLRFGVVRRAIAGRLVPSDLRDYFFWANPVQASLFRFMAILPGSIQALFWHKYRAIKAWVK